MCKKLDIRIVQLAKWKIPKTEEAFAEDRKDGYWSIGYFDMIHVKKVEYNGSKHPLTTAYEVSHRTSEDKTEYASENYNIQELIVFADVNDVKMTEEQIDQFWEDDSLLRYVSLIHIDNESDVNTVITKIDNAFMDTDYIYYFSFDYSGIVLFAKNLGIKQYLKKMFELNYNQFGKEEKKLIRDSYSLYGFNKKHLQKYFLEFETKEYKDVEIEDDGDEMSVSVNVGIQNYNTYLEFIKMLDLVKDVTYEKYSLFGRHDVSIVNEKANLKWLLYVQYLLEKFTCRSEDRNEKKVFLTHETFVKFSFGDEEFEDVADEEKDDAHSMAKERLSKLCKKFNESLEYIPGKYNGEYKVPIQAVAYSVLDIWKNRYAEDFVLCMYQSFCEFLEYLTDHIIRTNENKNVFDDSAEQFNYCFSEYFRGMNALVNSAMHSERQFIQVTAFNAIIYDVPAKIMAFYVAIVQRFQKLIGSKKDRKYTFLLTPSFHNEIAVKVISCYPYNRGFPLDRILMVMINEKSLYNPRTVIRRMGHEVAHFVGDELRCRAKRKKYIKHSLLSILLNQILYKSFIEEEKYNTLVREIYKSLPDNIIFADEENNYSSSLECLAHGIIWELFKNKKIRRLLVNHIKSVLTNCLGTTEIKPESIKKSYEIKEYIFNISKMKEGTEESLLTSFFEQKTCSVYEIDIIVRFIMNDIDNELEYLAINDHRKEFSHAKSQSVISQVNDGVLEKYSLHEYREKLKSVYTETFADMQMILLTGITYDAYLRGFLDEENLKLSQLKESLEDESRIAMIAFVLNEVHFWDIYRMESEFEKDSELFEFHQIIKEQIAILENSIPEGLLEASFMECQEMCQQFMKDMGDCHVNSIRAEKTVGRVNEIPQGNISAIVNTDLVLYLKECLKQSLRHYDSSQNILKIKELRKIINNVVDCNTIYEMFTTVCIELDAYKQRLF